ncbi:hypothetical protein H632_c2843p0, partial [Helicosporidium sp. ATCC 50920]
MRISFRAFFFAGLAIDPSGRSSEDLSGSSSADGKPGQAKFDEAVWQVKMEKLREKNRSAQARYRAKRRVAQGDLARRHDEVSAELAAARAEHALLSRESLLLERLVLVRDESIDLLRRSELGSAMDPISWSGGSYFPSPATGRLTMSFGP